MITAVIKQNTSRMGNQHVTYKPNNYAQRDHVKAE